MELPNAFLHNSDLATEYQGPLTQILHMLQLEPADTRHQNISRLQQALQSISNLIEESVIDCTTPAPADSPHRLPHTATLPPLQHPHTPHRALPTFATLPFLSPVAVPPLHRTNARPHKRRKVATSSSTALTHKLDPTALTALEQTVLRPRWDAQIAVTPECSRKSATDAAAQFQQQLCDLQVTEKKNNCLVISRINPTDIPLLIQFFFSDTFGEGCQKRMYALFDELVSQAQRQTQTPSLARQKADDQTLLPEVQAFFSTYARWHEEEEKLMQVVPAIATTIRAFELYNAFYQLREKASGPQGDELQAFLSAQGFSTSVGRDIRSCILKYLSRELGIPSGQLNNTLQAYQGIFLLVQHFGRGILVLLPKGAPHRMTRIGTQKMQRIIQIFSQTFSQAADVCSAAEFLIPYIKGDMVSKPPLLLGQQVALRPQISLSELFTPIRSANIQPVDDTTLLLITDAS